MTSPRDAFLLRVRQAVQAGNYPGSSAPVAPRGGIGYQGAGPDPAARFRDELLAAGGHPHLVPDRAAAIARILDLVGIKPVRRILLGRGAFLDTLDLAARLGARGLEVIPGGGDVSSSLPPGFFEADLGISGVDYLVAETGSVVLLARPDQPRSLSLLPPFHIAVADRAQLLPDLFDLFEAVATRPPDAAGGPPLSSCLSLITGPSKTGDIEQKLVTGVHGPGEIHVVLVTGTAG